MTLCKSCNKLIDLHSWRKYIMTNHTCNFCDMPHIACNIEVEIYHQKRKKLKEEKLKARQKYNKKVKE
mgnify:CR=1 FL=1